MSSPNDAPSVPSPATGKEAGIKDAACQKPKSQDEWKTSNLSETRDIQEEFITSLSVGDGRYLVDLGSSSEFIVDEECLLQLFESCRQCNRRCTVRKRVKGLKLVVNQACPFCESHSKWTNLPGDQDDDDDDDDDDDLCGKDKAHGETNSAKP